MAFNSNSSSNKSRKPTNLSIPSSLPTTLFLLILFSIPALLLLRTPPTPTSYSSTTCSTDHDIKSWSGDLRAAEFSWNKLVFTDHQPPALPLKIAVFSRKWPIGVAPPGGMERHAHTLHSALARRGHQVHVFTSPPPTPPAAVLSSAFSSSSESNEHHPRIHWYDGEPGKWVYSKSWEQFQEEENKRGPFDIVHSESVSLPYWKARGLDNLVVSWHGVALESLQSMIYQDLARSPKEPLSALYNSSLYGMVPKVVKEIKFFKNYAHHVAISDSCGEMLRDVYQIPSNRVHVIVNGVNEEDFKPDVALGKKFRSAIGVPQNATLVLGVAGRLVKDKGHPLLYEAFAKLIKQKEKQYSGVYLVVAGSGPWESRYKGLGPQVITLGSMNNSQLSSFYNSIDVFVNPTLRPQGLDLTLMEAMMSGKPVMSSRFPSIKGTIVVNSELGFMFPPNVDSLLETLELVVAEGSERLSERGKACREYAASMFASRKMALAYERLFLCIKNQTFCKYPWS